MEFKIRIGNFCLFVNFNLFSSSSSLDESIYITVKMLWLQWFTYTHIGMHLNEDIPDEHQMIFFFNILWIWMWAHSIYIVLFCRILHRTDEPKQMQIKRSFTLQKLFKTTINLAIFFGKTKTNQWSRIRSCFDQFFNRLRTHNSPIHYTESSFVCISL